MFNDDKIAAQIPCIAKNRCAPYPAIFVFIANFHNHSISRSDNIFVVAKIAVKACGVTIKGLSLVVNNNKIVGISLGN